MRQVIIAIHIFLISIAMTCAQQVTRDEAINAAINTLRYESQNDFANRWVDTVFSLRNNGNTILFEVHFSDNKIVLLTGHKSCVPVVGILQNHTLDFGNGLLANMELLPPGLQYFIENYIEQLSYCFQNNTPVYNDEWDALQVYDGDRQNSNRDVVPPLISAKWGQTDSYDHYPDSYNHFTPSCPVYGHCPVGCVAVAMGQIMKKWSYPQFIPNTCRHYNWSVMPDTLIQMYNGNFATQRDSIARFLLECGLKVNMSYCHGDCSENSSGAFDSDVPAALDSFGYKSTEVKYKSAYSQTDWDAMLHNDLDNGRPIYYAGSGSNGRHGFVCDGYNYNGLYHFNWGWSGFCDGWFYLNDLTPDTYSFTNNQCAVFNIHPRNCWEDIVFGCNRYFVVFSNASYSAENTIQNNYHIFSVMYGSSVVLKSGEEIILTDGFYAANGSDFVAKIEACAPDDLDMMANVDGDGMGERGARRDGARPVSTTENGAITLYPNPAHSTLTVESASAIRKITVYDMAGHAVMVETMCTSSLQQVVNTTSLHAGIYLVKAVTDQGTETAKFVKN